MRFSTSLRVGGATCEIQCLGSESSKSKPEKVLVCERLHFCRAVLIEPSAEKSDSVMADEQLEEVIQIRIENEHIETRPLLQRYSPSVSLNL